MNQNKQIGPQLIKTAMKPLVILIFLLVLASGLRAQVGINIDGSDPDNSAMLDVKSTGKGFLPPRVTLTATTDAATILSPAAGLLVYNTATTGDVSPGYYYFNGTSWVRIGTADQASQWTSGGNNIYYNTGYVGIGTTAPMHLFQAGSGAADLQSIAIRAYGNGTNWKGGAAFGYSNAAVILGELGGVAQIGGHTATLGNWANLAINAWGGNVGIGTTSPITSAELDVSSTTKGFLPPRMTMLERNAIASPAEGLMVFCTDCGYNNTGAISVFINQEWLIMSACLPPHATVAGTHAALPNQIIWNWSAAAGASGYRWNIVNDYYTSSNIGSDTTKTETGLSCNTAYTRYLWACNNCGNSSPTVMTQSTTAIIPSPAAASHVVSCNQVTWNWTTVVGANGYKWNSVNDYATAEDLGNVTSKTEPGLTIGATYTRYVWSYGNCGFSEATALSQLVPYYIGQVYGGGTVFYVDGTGIHGLIVNTESLFLDAQWGCLNSLISGTSTEIYASHLNTTNIVNGCAQAGIAARLCSDLVSGGYDDWLLPSRDALVQMYNNRIILGLEMLGTAWSSTEEGGCCATALNFLDGTLYTRYKDNNHVVKPIRVF